MSVFRWDRPGRRYRRGAWLPAVLGIGLAILLICLVNSRIRPLVVDLAGAQIHNEVLCLLHQAVEEAPLPYDEAISLEKDETGRVTLLKSDMNTVSAYRSRLTEHLIGSVDTLQAKNIRIPLGSLTGIDLLSGRGPGIPVRVLSIGVVKSEFENLFTSAGINQTRHQIMLDITVDTKFLFPGTGTHTETTAQICVADTIIVGAVPEHFTYINTAEMAGSP